MPYLTYCPDTPKQRVYELKSGVCTIGRQSDNTIVIEEDTISRHHAKIDIDTSILTDCGSVNHTFVNGEQVSSCHIKDGDWIRCGRQVIFKFTNSLPTTNKPWHPSEPKIRQIHVPQSPSILQQLAPQRAHDASILKLQEEEEQQQTVQKLQILLEVSKELCSTEEPQQLLEKILELIFQIMEIDRAVILLVNEESGELEQKAFKVREGLSSLHPFYSTKITNLAYQTGDAFLTEDSSRDERLKGSVSVISESIQTSICVPLKTFTDIIGVLYVDNLSLLKVYSQEDLEFLIALANQAAAHVYLAREWEKRKQTLKQHLLEIEIQIDQTKKEKEIEEIVNSDFFRSLEQRVEKLREDLA